MLRPTNVEVVRDERIIGLTWSDGRVDRLPIRTLRLACRCAGCVDEMTGRPLLDPATVPLDISIDDLALVGNYAVTFTFSDRHDTGVYPWDRLRALGEATT